MIRSCAKFYYSLFVFGWMHWCCFRNRSFLYRRDIFIDCSRIALSSWHCLRYLIFEIESDNSGFNGSPAGLDILRGFSFCVSLASLTLSVKVFRGLKLCLSSTLFTRVWKNYYLLSLFLPISLVTSSITRSIFKSYVLTSYPQYTICVMAIK